MSDAASFDFDLMVIGGGSGGYAAARTAASNGLKVAVVEGGAEVGGLCILRGCMPTKAMLYAAEVAHQARHADTWGLDVPFVGVDFPSVMARKAAMINDFASFRVKQLENGRFVFLRALARFVDPHTVALSTGEQYRARSFVISTGSVVSEPPLPSLTEIGYLTSDDAVSLQELPESLIILGGGAIAAEFAQFFARLDVQVTLIQRSERLLRDFDADAGETIERVFRKEGMTVYTNTKLTEAWRHEDFKGVTFEHAGETVHVAAKEILFALGRSPNTAGLDLANAGVETDSHGRIITNLRQQTSAPHIFAAGDCTGPHEIVHIAIQQGEIAAHNAQHPEQPKEMDYRLLTSVVFTEPQVAIVGMTEKAAQAAGIPYLAASYPFNDHGKSMIMEALDGFVKLLADPQTGEILGGECIGPVGGELIHEIVVAMHQRMTVRQLASVPHYHPTLAEIWTYPAEELADKIPAKS